MTGRRGFSIVAPMGKHDNRRSPKMRRRAGQRKLKARIKRRKTERRAAKTGTAKGSKKKTAKE